jgi:hypothetical protein
MKVRVGVRSAADGVAPDKVKASLERGEGWLQLETRAYAFGVEFVLDVAIRREEHEQVPGGPRLSQTRTVAQEGQ